MGVKHSVSGDEAGAVPDDFRYDAFLSHNVGEGRMKKTGKETKMQIPTDGTAAELESVSLRLPPDMSDQPAAEVGGTYAKPFLRPRDESQEGDLWCD